MPFKDLVDKYGSSIAADIKKKKMELQALKGPHEDDWWMKHPEVDSEDLRLKNHFCFNSTACVIASGRMFSSGLGPS